MTSRFPSHRRTLGALCGLALAAALAVPARANVFRVVTTDDEGPGTLRQAILDANAHPGADSIAFAIPGDGAQTISPADALPDVSDALTVDAATAAGIRGSPLIELEGSAAATSDTAGLRFAAAHCVARGLAVNRFGRAGIEMAGGGGLVDACRVGTDAAGAYPLGNSAGIVITSSGDTVQNSLVSGNAVGIWIAAPSQNATVKNCFVGTDAPGAGALSNLEGIWMDGAAGCLIKDCIVSGNTSFGIGVGAGAANATVQNCSVGLDAYQGPLPNGADGVEVWDGHGALLQNSLIAANGGAGVLLHGAATKTNTLDGNTILGNAAGVVVRDGAAANTVSNNTVYGSLGNGVTLSGAGATVNYLTGNDVEGSGGAGVSVTASGNVVSNNTIAWNTGDGVSVGAENGVYATGVSVRGNAIHDNGDLGIRLASSGGAGANKLQPAPVLSLALSDGVHTTVTGTLNAAPGRLYDVEFFSSPEPDPSGEGEGALFLGTVSATTDAAGAAPFSVPLPDTGAGAFLSATATDPDGDTSAFSLALAVGTPGASPTVTRLAPASALRGASGFTLSVQGTGFSARSVVRWNGQDRATTFVSATQLTAAIPASDLLRVGPAGVSVFNAPPGGGLSNTLAFTVANATPSISALLPASATAGGAGFTLTVMGDAFFPDSVARWNGTDLVTAYLSPNQLTAAVPASLVALAGTVAVNVFNPGPGGASAPVPFVVNNPVPVLSGLAPAARTAGGPAFTLTVDGSRFAPGAVARWNGADRPTTFVSATRVTASIAAADIAAPGSAAVTVANPAPGGGSSPPLAFSIAADTTPPETSITLGPDPGGVLCQTSAKFAFAGTDDATPAALLRFQWHVDGGAWSAPGPAAITVSGLTTGAHTLFAAAVDAAGNADSTPAALAFTVSADPPALRSLRLDRATATAAGILWETDRPATSTVEVRKASDASWTATPPDPSLTLNHHVLLNNLAPFTAYMARARSTDACGRETVSPELPFTTAKLPDLAVTGFQADSSVATGERVHVTWQVTDTADGDAPGGWSDTISLASDANPAGTELVRVAHPDDLAAGQSYAGAADVVIPGVAAGTAYRFVLKTDADGTLAERAKDNNTATLGPVQLVVAVPPDVAPPPDATAVEGTSFNGPAPVVRAGTAPISWLLVSGPDGLTVDAATGATRWAAAVASETPYTVSLQAANVAGTATVSFQLTVPLSYTATASTDTNTAPAGASVVVEGHATRAGGGAAANVPVDVVARVQGTRRVFRQTTDSRGDYFFVLPLLPTEAGLYTIGAKHPAASSDTVQDTFTLYGMAADPVMPAQTLVPGGMADVDAIIRNLGDTPLTAITASVDNATAGTTVQVVSAPTSLPALGTAPVRLHVVSTGTDEASGTATLHLRSAEGATLALSLSLAVKPPVPVLEAAPAALNAAMPRGMQTVVQFDVTNTGGAPSDALDVQIPAAPWLALASPATLAPIPPGGHATVVLLLTPASDLALGAYTGSLVVGAGRGYGIRVPYAFIATSDQTGGLRVTPQDEFSFYADGHPNVAGASVTLSDPYTHAVVATATTGADGSATFPRLPEATYDMAVTADKHTEYHAPVSVAASQTTQAAPFIARQVVTYTWDVTPTTVEDEYNITVDATFETQVPAPVITVTPGFVDLRAITRPREIDFTITNHGLVSAQNMALQYAGNDDYRITVLAAQIGELKAGQSITVPVLFEPVSDRALRGRMPRSDGSCLTVQLEVHWTLFCGVNIPYLIPVGFQYNPGACPTQTSGGATGVTPGGGNPGPGSPTSFNPTASQPVACDPCTAKRLEAVGKCLLSWIKIPACYNGPYGFYKCGKCYYDKFNGGYTVGQVFRCGLDCVSGGLNVAKCYFDVAYKGISTLIKVIKCSYDFVLIPGCELIGGKTQGIVQPMTRGRRTGESLALGNFKIQTDRLQAFANTYIELFGDATWLDGETEDGQIFSQWVDKFQQFISETSDAQSSISDSEQTQLLELPRPRQLNEANVIAFLERWNRTMRYWEAGIFRTADIPVGGNTDFIDLERFARETNLADAGQDANQRDGFTGMYDAWGNAASAVVSELDAPKEEGVCARVKVSIQQRAVISRAAFNATLEISNSGATPLTNLAVDLIIKDATGQISNQRFDVRGPALTNLSDVTGTGSVAGGQTGKAVWTLVPGDLAAPDGRATYTVGGSFSYTLDGNQVTIPLFPATIDVLPNAKLRLRYFWQKDVVADDPFTPEVEPSVPFVLGLLATNTGKGVANNFRITSSQPKIVDNEKGLLIDFQIIGSQVNGQAVSPSLKVDLGDVNPGETVGAEWFLTSTLQGKFIGYDATFQHVNGLNDPQFSLLDSVDVHELIHPVCVDAPADDGRPDYLVNDIPDANSLPDRVYNSDGTDALVAARTDAAVDAPIAYGHLQAQLTLAAPPAGFFYIRINDPGQGAFRLTRAVRSDGKEVRVGDNAWTTERTVRLAGQAPYKERYLHLFDAGGTGTYTLTFEAVNPAPRPVLTALRPNYAPAGTGNTVLGVSGSGFMDGATVRWNGLGLDTTFLSATKLTAALPASFLARSGAAAVSVQNPAVAGGGVSDSLAFTVGYPRGFGDVDNDGAVTMADAVLLLRAAGGLGPAQNLAGDVAPSPSTATRGYGDGRVDVLDVLTVMRLALETPKL